MRLEIVREYRGGDGRLWYELKCSCGKTHNARKYHVTSGAVKSCGCLNSEVTATRNYRHGLTNHPLYHLWESIKRRCLNPKQQNYERYGGRGIRVADCWVSDPAAFISYVQHNLGPKPAGHSIDRIDVNGNYEPGNIRWATAVEQAANKRP